jgi:ABC-type lipoprotein export system ATPase subunit/DNA-binding CsgD family transcriptional regulator
MLKLVDIKKDYKVADTVVPALKGVSVSFRKNEFVSILGPSGCGKTTLLNIIGGLDRYTEGDLIIDSKSTKLYKDAEWDSYRNHTIGFIFQSYNLIPHQSVLSNVELALTLSGVSKAERKKRATEALEKVGLGDQITKKPNQLSGGQMQRVAIARALVNNPEISVLSARTSGTLSINESTKFMPFNYTQTAPSHQAFTLVHPTYIISGDDEIDTITRIENLLCRSDAIDREYIELLINEKETKDFAEKHFISENTLNYRIKNMCKTLGVGSRKELQKTLKMWMS